MHNYTDSKWNNKFKKIIQKNVKSYNVKDLSTPFYGCPEIMSKYTGDTQDKF